MRPNRRLYQAEYRRKNKDKIAEYQAEYQRKNKDKIAIQGAEYYKKNKDKISEYRRKNKDKIAIQQAEYYRKNKNKIAECRRNKMINLPVFGGRGKRYLYTNGATEEMKKRLPKIVKKVLDDCIKNPRKYLNETKQKQEWKYIH